MDSQAFSRSQRVSRATKPESEIAGWLTPVITIFGAALIAFFVPLFLVCLFRIELPPALDILVRWGPGGAEQYEEMISIIYIVWGVYLIRAARQPFENQLFLDFSLAANVAHASLMATMAVFNEEDRIHLIGDVLAYWLALGPFVYVWTQCKRKHH